jgi:hypothetical protein
MAIVLIGKTECVLCGGVLRDGDEVVSFSPFVSNELDPLWKFSDAAFHATCFHEDPLSEKARQRYHELRSHVGPGRRMCVVCKKEIMEPNDYFGVGYLTDDQHPLHRYNYTQAHRSCLSQWSERSQLSKLLDDFNKSGAWRGVGLESLLSELDRNR